MANLKVSIVVRPTVGKRTPVPATGKNDPAGSYYLRYCVGNVPKLVKAGESYRDAEIAQIRLERKLKAASQGFLVPDEVAAPSMHRCSEALTSYLTYLRSPKTKKRNGRRYHERSILSRESNILEFLKETSRVNVEQITRADLLKYRDFLFGKQRANDTVYNKLAVVVTWMKKNQLVEIKSLLRGEDWPIVRETKAHPFRAAEITAQMERAGEHQLLIRLARGTGMRKKELAHAERSDIDPYAKSIHVKNKPHFNWETKTPADVREIPLGDDLLADVLKMGLRVFPLQPGTKIPMTAHGVKDATDDSVLIKEWWIRTPEAGIGLAARDQHVGDPCFLEFDQRPWLAAWAKELGQEKPVTRLHKSGGKESPHYIFRHTEKSLALGNCDGAKDGHEWFSFRAANRYIVAPPWFASSGTFTRRWRRFERNPTDFVDSPFRSLPTLDQRRFTSGR